MPDKLNRHFNSLQVRGLPRGALGTRKRGHILQEKGYYQAEGGGAESFAVIQPRDSLQASLEVGIPIQVTHVVKVTNPPHNEDTAQIKPGPDQLA